MNKLSILICHIFPYRLVCIANYWEFLGSNDRIEGRFGIYMESLRCDAVDKIALIGIIVDPVVGFMPFLLLRTLGYEPSWSFLKKNACNPANGSQNLPILDVFDGLKFILYILCVSVCPAQQKL